MKASALLNRRRFLQSGLLGSTALAATSFTSDSNAALTKTPGDPFHGLKMGLTSYTWRNFKLDQAIEMTKEADAKYISLKEVHLPLKSTPEQRREVRKKIEDAGLTLMGGGVIYFKNNEEEIHNVFEYAKDAGMGTIVCSPEPDALDRVEKMVKQYDLRIAIHNHGPTDKKYPSPLDVMSMVKNRDSRMGVCMDVGHTVRIGQDPVAAIEQCASRLYEFHMKDVTAAVASGKGTEVGKGVIDVVGVLKALVKLKWPYHVALEYEVKADNPLPGVVESFAYMRGILAAL
jgi:sugar phosphate isomerase/epimerase